MTWKFKTDEGPEIEFKVESGQIFFRFLPDLEPASVLAVQHNAELALHGNPWMIVPDHMMFRVPSEVMTAAREG